MLKLIRTPVVTAHLIQQKLIGSISLFRRLKSHIRTHCAISSVSSAIPFEVTTGLRSENVREAWLGRTTSSGALTKSIKFREALIRQFAGLFQLCEGIRKQLDGTAPSEGSANEMDNLNSRRALLQRRTARLNVRSSISQPVIKVVLVGKVLGRVASPSTIMSASPGAPRSASPAVWRKVLRTGARSA